jgi:hypothetical protein
MDRHTNFAASTVVVAPSPADTGTELRIASNEAKLFPLPPFNATVSPYGQVPTAANAEIVRVTAMTGDLMTMIRAQEGSTARPIVVGDSFAATITAKTLQDIEEIVGPTGWWTNIAYNPQNFTANAGSWDVEAPDVTTFAWTLVGKTLFLTLSTVNASITAGGAYELQVKLPGAYVSAYTQDLGPFWYFDGSPAGWQLGACVAYIGDSFLRLYKSPAGGNWNVNVATTHVSFSKHLAVL